MVLVVRAVVFSVVGLDDGQSTVKKCTTACNTLFRHHKSSMLSIHVQLLLRHFGTRRHTIKAQSASLIRYPHISYAP